MNLLKETLEDIQESGHTVEDIIFIGSEDGEYRCTWDKFVQIADIEYDNGFGTQIIASDLIIVYNDNSIMWRHEYDGSEGWIFSKPFKMLQKSKPIKRLHVQGNNVGWQTIKEIMDYREKLKKKGRKK